MIYTMENQPLRIRPIDSNAMKNTLTDNLLVSPLLIIPAPKRCNSSIISRAFYSEEEGLPAPPQTAVLA